MHCHAMWQVIVAIEGRILAALSAPQVQANQKLRIQSIFNSF